MRYRTNRRSLCAVMLYLSLLPCLTGTAGAADTSMPWNPKFTPAVSRVLAIRLARKHIGTEARESTCTLTQLVSTSRDHVGGEWRVTFEGKPHTAGKQVVVAFHKGRPNMGIRVFRGAIAR